LKASVTQDERGTVVSGTLDWSGLLSEIWSGAGLGLFLIVPALLALSRPDFSLAKIALSLLLLVLGTTAIWSSFRRRRKESERRQGYLAKLNRELEANLTTWR